MLLPITLTLMLTFVAMVALMAIHRTRLRRERLADPIYCVHCGYDLRGNLDTPICPECGEQP